MSNTNSNEVQILEGAIRQMNQMTYALALRTTLIKMLDECERLAKDGANVVELVNLIRIANDYMLYLKDTQDELPEVV